jgi:hypothetical protein
LRFLLLKGERRCSQPDFGPNVYIFHSTVPQSEIQATEVPTTLPVGSLHDLLTIFLSTAGSGGILNMINNTGGSSTIANPDVPVTVMSYP